MQRCNYCFVTVNDKRLVDFFFFITRLLINVFLKTDISELITEGEKAGYILKYHLIK